MSNKVMSNKVMSNKVMSNKVMSNKVTSNKVTSKKPVMPSDVTKNVGWFDRFADAASHIASRAYFFAFCVLLVVLWAPSILILHSIDTWQLIINTATTIITFLLVALLQNSQERSDQAVQEKLNAIAGSLSDLMKAKGLEKDAVELRDAVGLEDHESSSDNTGPKR